MPTPLEALLTPLVLLGALFPGLPVYWSWRLVWLYGRSHRPGEQGLPGHGPAACADEELPRAAVLLPLRGADPSLEHCLVGLLNQNYPHYQLHIVFDCDEDPARAMVERILATHGKPGLEVKISLLRNRHDTCSLKVSAQIQAIRDLDPDIEAVAFIDADVTPGRDWLRSLISPLSDPRVGATTGIRWYAPEDLSWGSLVRYIWNAGATTQMYAFHIPWGGSLALHARVFRHPDLIEQWSRSFGEDTCAYGVIRSLGVELRFLPSVTMINHESIDLKGCCTFVRRQLFSARMNHANWAGVLWSSIGTAVTLCAALGILVFGLVTGRAAWAIAAGAGLAFHGLGQFTALLLGDATMRAMPRQQRQKVPCGRFSWRYLPAMVLALTLHFACLLSALFLRRIDWRGITYAVESPGRLRLLEYKPYRPVKDAVTSRSIL